MIKIVMFLVLALSWLHGYLAPAGINPQWVATCERVLVVEQGIRTRDMFAALPASYLDDAHLTTLGLIPMSVRLELRRLHARLQWSVELRERLASKSEATKVVRLSELGWFRVRDLWLNNVNVTHSLYVWYLWIFLRLLCKCSEVRVTLNYLRWQPCSTMTMYCIFSCKVTIDVYGKVYPCIASR